MDGASSVSTRKAKSNSTRHSANNASVMEAYASSEHNANSVSQIEAEGASSSEHSASRDSEIEERRQRALWPSNAAVTEAKSAGSKHGASNAAMKAGSTRDSLDSASNGGATSADSKHSRMRHQPVLTERLVSREFASAADDDSVCCAAWSRRRHCGFTVSYATSKFEYVTMRALTHSNDANNTF